MTQIEKPSTYSEFMSANPDKTYSDYAETIKQYKGRVASLLGITVEAVHELGPIIVEQRLNSVTIPEESTAA